MKNLALLNIFLVISCVVHGQNIFPQYSDVIINRGNFKQTGNFNIETQGAMKLKNYLLFDSDGDFTGGNYYTIQDDQQGNYLRIGYKFQNNIIVNSLGNVGIGTENPDTKLTVKGTIHSEEVKVEVVGADFVFAPEYNLMPLAETEAYIKQNHHLPEVPSAEEMEANGVELGKMNMLLLQKIEELTLHQIEMNKMLLEQQKQLKLQNQKIANLENNLK